MKILIGVSIIWGFFLGAVTSDKNCDDIMEKQDVRLKYTDTLKSTDLVVCSEIAEIKCGEDYAPAILEYKPTIYFDVGESCSYVTIVFFGRNPDSNDVNLLWVVYNIEVGSLKEGFNGQTGMERVVYTKPKTGEGIAPHYFFVYCQSDYLQIFNCCTPEERNNFNPKEFAKSNKLKEVTAALFFRTTATGEVMKDSNTKQETICKKN